jgi:ubiquinol-cytochrome c reductase cytochrome b subunit
MGSNSIFLVMRLNKIPLISVINDHIVDYPTPVNLSYFWGFGSLVGVCLAMYYTPHVDLVFNSSEHIMRLNKIPLISVINDHIVDYPTPINLSYFWGFGSLVGVCLAMYYTPHVDLAFNSSEHIMRNVNNGWLIRYIHSSGTPMFFIAVYTHIGRGLYYTSYGYPRLFLSYSGIVICILIMATAFMGWYVLPWGATVIISLFSALPYVGKSIAFWLWGGFSIDNATLNRFFSVHYLLPFRRVN